MEQTDKTRTQDTSMLARATAMSAGDFSIAVRAELTRLRPRTSVGCAIDLTLGGDRDFPILRGRRRP
jgi:hypothetical protein